MAADTYFPQYHAYIETDDIDVTFYRLCTDARDVMSDSLKPSWEPLDKFIINLRKLKTTRQVKKSMGALIKTTDVEVVDRYEIRTDSKQAANYIWYLAKNGTRFDDIVAMDKAKKF